jgi:hypothetical protein
MSSQLIVKSIEKIGLTMKAPQKPSTASVPRGRIEISVPTAYKKPSDEVWQELEAYLFMGFLTATAPVSNQYFTFKTLNQYELRLIELLRPDRMLVPDARASFRNYFIAYSVFAVQGENAVFQRPRHIRRLVKVISRLSAPVQDKIVEHLSALNERAARLHPLVEAYAYENRSRFRWMHVRGSSVHSPLNTGIPGTEELGMNACQQIWIALNHIIDQREEIERNWTNAKFIGSCFAGKGVRSIDERDRSRLERERTEREELKMKVLYEYLNRVPSSKELESVVQLPGGRTAKVVKKFKAESAEDLAAELQAALNGEMDFHDRVVAAQQAKMVARVKDLDRQRFQLLSAQSPAPEGGSRILGNKAEAEEYLKRFGIAKTQYHHKIRSSEASDEE